MALRVHNSLTRQKEDFAPLKPGKVGMYVCGVTTYDLCHVGHARVYVVFDTVLRWLERDYDVTYVRNFTDVDDKIIKRANETGEDPIRLAARYADEFHVDMGKLGVRKAHVEPRVSTHIPEIVAFIEALEQKGFAYRVKGAGGDDVYFRVRAMDAARYVQLSGRSVEDLFNEDKQEARVTSDERKEERADFALWKSAKPGEVFWPSPFGNGRPGWHIECSAMSEKHLGATFDIHGGGKDLIFPHHTNEIAQSECKHGQPMARYWLHNGFINFDGEKMSKSLGNFFTIRDVLEFGTGEALRFQLLSTHYRSEVGFDVLTTCPKCNAELSTEAQRTGKCQACAATSSRDEIRARVRFPLLEEAERRVQSLYETRRRVVRYLEKTPHEDGPSLEHVFKLTPMKDFVDAMEDDFNTAGALASLWELTRVQNLLVDGREKERLPPSAPKLKPAQRACLLREAKNLVEQMCKVLGVGEREPAQFLDEQRELRMRAKGIALSDVERLLGERAVAKAQKDYAAADAARAALLALGVEVRDTPEGVEWTIA